MNTAAQILATLRSTEHGVSGSDLCRRLHISRAAVWSHIESLRDMGFEIVASPHRGYQLVKAPDKLLTDDMMSKIGKVNVIGRKITVLDQTTSTNDVIEKAAINGHDEGLVVFAESQTRGRGRMGRRWSSHAGKGLWFSVLLRPNLTPGECTQLTAATATALTRAIRDKTYITPEIKYNLAAQLTNKAWATGYNNFYEFTTNKELVRHPFYMDKFKVDPWQIQITGLCEKPFKINAQQLIADMGLEERVYRFRCVEAWSMIVPWSGFTLRKIIEKAVPKKQARFVKFTTAMNLKQMPGIARLPTYPWPYTEGLRLDEAMHELTFVATGIYGKPLPKQNGAPIRLVVPWKYGYKSIKSIVKIEFTAKQPKTLWESLAPDEYPFESNVNPAVAHPRWSQASERLIGTGLRIRTAMYNSYKEVAPLYARR